MKATGIVRRIDDLGRVVIPKEIRRTLRFERATCRKMILAQWEKFLFYGKQFSQKKWVGVSTWADVEMMC